MAKRTTNTNKSVSASSPNKKEILLSEQEVYDVLRFAQALYSGNLGVYTPELVNSRMKDVTLNPQVATLEAINKALGTPNSSEEQLIGYSQWLELTSMLYKRILLYFSGLLSFDFTYVATNVKKASEYNSPKYQKDLEVVQEFFDCFDIKDAFKTVMRQMLRNETYFGILRDDGEKYILQELPRKYCKITGRFDYGLLFDFDMKWFIQPAVSLDMYPSVFKKMYKKAFEGKGSSQYDPALDANLRDSSWVYYVQTSPSDGFVAFKLFPEMATNIPFLAPFMPDVVIQPLIRSLQTNSYIAQASKFISGEVPYLKESKASVKDALALDPTTLGKFLALMNSALPEAIKIISAPLSGIGAVEFAGNNDIYDSYLSTSASSSGINSRLIYSRDRQNMLETKLSMDIDNNVLRPVYAVFENMLSYWVNQRTKHYKFKFSLEGFNTTLDREERLGVVSQLAESGMVLEQKYASAIGMNVFDFRRQLAEAKALGFVKNLTPIVKASQTPAGAGRPKKGDSELSDAGAETRESGTNDEKSEE